MMLIATSVVSALVASSALAAATASPPAAAPIIVHVTTAADLSPRLVKAILAETDAIWRQCGVTFVWRRIAARGAA